MAIIIFLNWWYGAGWANSFKAIFKRAEILADDLSIPILLRTLFEPWKQIKLYSGQSSSLDLKLHVLAENLFSRVFGFFIRIFVILFGTIALFATIIFGIIIAVIWPAIPVLPIIYLVMAGLSI